MNGNVPQFSLLKFKTLIRNDHGPDSPVTDVLYTQEELDEYIESCQGKSRPNHAVDFPEERAIAVALGPRRRAGHVVEILAVVQETGGFLGVQNHVLFVEHVHHGAAADVIAYPHHVIRVRGLSGIVSFRQVPDMFGLLVLALLGGPMAGQMGQMGMAGQMGQMGQMGMAAAGAAVSPAQQPSTMPFGEQGGVTTLALGEEGPFPTTLAVGEEGPARCASSRSTHRRCSRGSIMPPVAGCATRWSTGCAADASGCSPAATACAACSPPSPTSRVLAP